MSVNQSFGQNQQPVQTFLPSSIPVATPVAPAPVFNFTPSAPAVSGPTLAIRSTGGVVSPLQSPARLSPDPYAVPRPFLPVPGVGGAGTIWSPTLEPMLSPYDKTGTLAKEAPVRIIENPAEDVAALDIGQTVVPAPELSLPVRLSTVPVGEGGPEATGKAQAAEVVKIVPVSDALAGGGLPAEETAGISLADVSRITGGREPPEVTTIRNTRIMQQSLDSGKPGYDAAAYEAETKRQIDFAQKAYDRSFVSALNLNLKAIGVDPRAAVPGENGESGLAEAITKAVTRGRNTIGGVQSDTKLQLAGLVSAAVSGVNMGSIETLNSLPGLASAVNKALVDNEAPKFLAQMAAEHKISLSDQELAVYERPDTLLNAEKVRGIQGNYAAALKTLEDNGYGNTSLALRMKTRADYYSTLLTTDDKGKPVFVDQRGSLLPELGRLASTRPNMFSSGANLERLNDLAAQDPAILTAYDSLKRDLSDPDVDNAEATTRFWQATKSRLSYLGAEDKTQGFWGWHDALGNSGANWTNIMGAGALSLALAAPFENAYERRRAEKRADKQWEREKDFQLELLGKQHEYSMEALNAQLASQETVAATESARGTPSGVNVAQFA